jgi:hypothetical protein
MPGRLDPFLDDAVAGEEDLLEELGFLRIKDRGTALAVVARAQSNEARPSRAAPVSDLVAESSIGGQPFA